MAVGNTSEAKSPIQVTGDGPRGIGHSGVGFSAIGHRLQDPAAENRNEFPTANRLPLTPIVGRVGHPWPAAAEQGCSALPD